MSNTEKRPIRDNNVLKRSTEKKDIILNTKKKPRLLWVLVGAACVLVLGGSMLFFTRNTEQDTHYENPPGSRISATSVTYPADLFSDGKARHFRHKVDDAVTIQYFILKSADGMIRAAFDACDVCWPAGKGYQQSGDVMVCRNCGQQFASIRVNEVKGGCNPAPLERKIEDDKVVLEVQDILSGKKYFDFSKRG
ncbi:MAG: Fe-S-containing protein [Thermodesulfobacteriota bacterium]